MKMYLIHSKTGRRFEIVQIDRANGKVKLKGPNSTFTEEWNPERFKANGYALVKEDPDAKQ